MSFSRFISMAKTIVDKGEFQENELLVNLRFDEILSIKNYYQQDRQAGQNNLVFCLNECLNIKAEFERTLLVNDRLNSEEREFISHIEDFIISLLETAVTDDEKLFQDKNKHMLIEEYLNRSHVLKMFEDRLPSKRGRKRNDKPFSFFLINPENKEHKTFLAQIRPKFKHLKSVDFWFSMIYLTEKGILSKEFILHHNGSAIKEIYGKDISFQVWGQTSNNSYPDEQKRRNKLEELLKGKLSFLKADNF